MLRRSSAARWSRATAPRKPQDLARGSYFGGRRPEDGRIDWSKSAREIHNLVRAVAPPYPGAFTDRTEASIRTRIEPSACVHPGSVLGPYRKDGEWFAACGDGGSPAPPRSRDRHK